MYAAIYACGNLPILLQCSKHFSPLIEITSSDLVTFDIRGLGRVFGPPDHIAQEIDRMIGIPAQIAIAANPDTAIYAARGFPGITMIAPGNESGQLAPLSLHHLGCADEIGEILDAWGIRTFGAFATLPPLGIAARLGAEGTYWQQQAQGAVHRQLRVFNESVRFCKTHELDDTLSNLDQLLFLIGRFLFDLCLELRGRFLATKEIRIHLRLEQNTDHQVHLHIPAPLTDSKALLSFVRLELERRPPPAPIVTVEVELLPTTPKTTQEDLFAPSYPAPEQIELSLARIRRIVGPDNVGTPEVQDTHRPDAFVMRPFVATSRLPTDPSESPISLAFRRYRPPEPAHVRVDQQPVHIASRVISGPIRSARGPWYISGEWWMQTVWNREEWDIALPGDTLYRIFRDLETQAWFVEGNYD